MGWTATWCWTRRRTTANRTAFTSHSTSRIRPRFCRCGSCPIRGGSWLAAMLHAALIAAAAWLTYKVARRYAAPNVATLAGLLTLFALTATANFPAIRPEAISDSHADGSGLSVRHLAIGRQPETPGVRLRAGRCAWAANAQQRIDYLHLSRAVRHLAAQPSDPPGLGSVAIGTLTASSLVGLAIVLVPHPSHLFELLRQLGVDGQRYTFVMGEIRRFLFLGAARAAAFADDVPGAGGIGRHRAGAAGFAAGTMFRAPVLGRSNRRALRLRWLGGGAGGRSGCPTCTSISPLCAYWARSRTTGARPCGCRFRAGAVMLAVIALEVPVITAMRGGLREWMVVGLVYSAIATPLLCWSWYKGESTMVVRRARARIRRGCWSEIRRQSGV